MQVEPIQTRILIPPQDNLLAAIQESSLSLQEGDCVAVSSKVVSIWQGRCVPNKKTHKHHQVDELARHECNYYLDRSHTPHNLAMFTITENILINKAGIDRGNSDGYYLLWPKKPKEVAKELLTWLQQTYGRESLSVLITDSRSQPLRRGVTGVAIGWAGFNPLVHHRYRDLFNRRFQGHTNLPDALAAAAVLVMGEADECTPLAVIRNVPYLKEQMASTQEHSPPYELPMKDDIFAPFLTSVPWQEGGRHPK